MTWQAAPQQQSSLARSTVITRLRRFVRAFVRAVDVHRARSNHRLPVLFTASDQHQSVKIVVSSRLDDTQTGAVHRGVSPFKIK